MLSDGGYSKERLILIGIDGLSWYIYEKLRYRGYLSFLDNLISEGFRGSVKSIPPLTPPAWTSIFTGVNPGKHGIYQFFITDTNGKIKRLHNSLDVGFPRIFHVASILNKTSIVINIPLLYPYVPFKGAFLSDWLSPMPTGRPKDLAYIFSQERGKYKQTYLNEEKNNNDEYMICKMLQHDWATLSTLSKYLNRNQDFLKKFDIILMVFMGIDISSHYDFDNTINPRISCYIETLELFDNFIREYVMPLINDYTSILVVSDHGNLPLRYTINLPKILYDAGLIEIEFKPLREWYKLREEKLKTGETSDMLTTQPDNRTKFLTKLINFFTKNKYTGTISRKIGHFLLNKNLISIKQLQNIERPVIDFTRSRIVIPEEFAYGLFINNKENANNYEIFLKLKKALFEFQNRVGEPIIYDILIAKGNLYRGKYVDRAPDVLLLPNKGFSFNNASIYAPYFIKSKNKGTHFIENLHVIVPNKNDEILIDFASNIKTIYDYAALMYKSLNIPFPIDLDANILDNKTCSRYRCKNYLPYYKVMISSAKQKITTLP